MREYKFRGKRKDIGTWVYGYLFTSNMSGAYILSTKTDTRYTRNGSVSMGDKLIQHEVDPETVGQFTGLKEKNGKEIYEGDILHHKWNCGYDEWLETISEVKWNKGAFVVDDKKRSDWLLFLHACADKWAEVEVIGNIYENSYLLEEK